MFNLSATGRIVKDAELRKTSNGKSVIDIVIACDLGGDKTQYVKTSLWDKQAESLAPYMKQGRSVEVNGQPYAKGREYNGKVYTDLMLKATAFRFLDAKPKDAEPAPAPAAAEPVEEMQAGVFFDLPF